MTDELAAIEAALEMEENMMARQRLLKRRWKLRQAVAKVNKNQQHGPQSKDDPKATECSPA